MRRRAEPRLRLPDLIRRNGLAELLRFFLSLLKLPLDGFDFAFRAPPVGARPDAQDSAAIGEPNAHGLIGCGFWMARFWVDSPPEKDHSPLSGVGNVSKKSQPPSLGGTGQGINLPEP